ncbi:MULTISPECIES: AAA family ATPase [unclassified Bradyrhizobium]|uniref:AAA family ATPase n=1 Tax=unclassified Bradyrhizobium TaxID=2631580 RepID=UPI0028EBE2B2|nr:MULTISPECIES: AAA family ATPase [unclassified Bradyrhizobium]
MLIQNICKLRNAAILAELTAKAPSVDFKRYNLIYGFNGSGKSTLSRCFSALQGYGLPAGWEFEVATSEGATVPATAGNALASHIAVFNDAFINENLQWSAGRARPVFYIGKEQAEVAAELRKTEAAIPVATEKQNTAELLLKSKEQALIVFRREQARAISREIRPANRKYEAPQLAADYENLDLGADAALDENVLSAHKELCRLEEAMPQISILTFSSDEAKNILETVIDLLQQTPSLTVIAELQRHPEMLLWVQEGRNYHVDHDLGDCLLCGGPLTSDRKELLARALDEGIDNFVKKLNDARTTLMREKDQFLKLPLLIASSKDISADWRERYEKASARVTETVSDAVKNVFEPALAAIESKLRKPATALPAAEMAWVVAIAEALSLVDSWAGVVSITSVRHNEACDKFAERQEAARVGLRRHYLAEKKDTYKTACDDVVIARENGEAATRDLADLQAKAIELRARVKEHGQAAAKINRLIEAYLGHKELSIVSVDKGYEIHRRGKPITGSPSEGEKTAIALCYFLSTLEAEGRTVKNRIVVVDDPISSLDSRALNYACSLLLSRLTEAAQVFVLTHNQNCMNEFKKAWSKFYRPRNPATPATATLLFLDVKVPKGGTRSSSLVELSRLLREYESEYHYLVDHVLSFDASDDKDYEYAYMMPNVLRRVLDVFLAFRCPGSAGFASKMSQLTKEHSGLDPDRIAAMERLVQLESHSDSIDDLIGFSAMTLEESKAATAALLALMETVDPDHLAGLKHLCRKPA